MHRFKLITLLKPVNSPSLRRKRRRRQSQRILRSKRMEYGQAMTLHGLPRVMYGENIVERIVWGVSICAGVVISLVLCYELLEVFSNYMLQLMKIL